MSARSVPVRDTVKSPHPIALCHNIYPVIFSSIKAVTIKKTACQNNLQKTSDSYNSQYRGN